MRCKPLGAEFVLPCQSMSTSKYLRKSAKVIRSNLWTVCKCSVLKVILADDGFQVRERVNVYACARRTFPLGCLACEPSKLFSSRTCAFKHSLAFCGADHSHIDVEEINCGLVVDLGCKFFTDKV